jgi:hypothetical protein
MKFRKLRSTAFLLVLLLSSGVRVIAQSKSFYGAYQGCSFACTTIQINPDFTFVYRLSGDLFNDERTNGTWRFVGQNRIRAVSTIVNTEPQVTETEAKRTGSFLITLLDAFGGPISGAKVSGVVNGVAFERKTNSEGVAEIPECKQFDVTGGQRNYRGTHRVKNPRANVFTVSLTNEQMFESYIDEVWQIEKGCLYVVESDGSVDRDYCLKKLSRKKERKIFGEAMPNNSFNRSGMSLNFIRKIECCSAILPARLIRALCCFAFHIY